VPSFRSKHQDKLALRSIMVAEPAVPRYLNWSQYPIQFSREDQWTSVGNVGLYPLVLDPTIVRMTVTKVLIDRGAGLNIIFFRNAKKDGIRLCRVGYPNRGTILWNSTQRPLCRSDKSLYQLHLEHRPITEPNSFNLKL
jgi:hypothetical protein